ncbi:MAG: hypothetical protein FVQ82_17170 [Planctomycetes bacterium]|nr:hypothetical protein [Planctomycetota bacterium]
MTLNKGTHGRRPSNVRESIARVVNERRSISVKESKNVKINGNNNIFVEGNYYEAKNYKPAKNYKHYSKINRSTGSIHYLSSHSWCGCGRFHLLRWSNTSCSRVVYFKRGLSFGLSYMYPSHHRKYVFVSIGGHIPHSYRYRRYYRYGFHPTTWYGSQPYEYPSVDNSVTNNNYYYAADSTSATYDPYDTSYGRTYSSTYAGSYESSYGSSAETYSDVSSDDFRYVRDRLAASQANQVAEAIEDMPAEETLADVYFGNAVEAFGGGDYQSAIDAVNKAIVLAPEDEVLPFTLAQSLFADGRYTQAVVLLRKIFNKMPRNRETLYYPRGLYLEEKVLEKQILALSKKVENEPANTELNLLLAYHLLGTGELDKVAGPLYQATFDEENSVSVAIMEDLLEEAQKSKQLEIENNM